jgi:anthranilate/para-aminobenzoate synthase component I
MIGFVAYDAARYLETHQIKNPPPDDRRIPDLLFGLYGELVIFDHLHNTVAVVANASVEPGSSSARRRSSYVEAARRVDQLVSRLQQPSVSKLGELDLLGAASLSYSSALNREQFESAVQKAQRYIRSGDISEVALSQRFRVTSSARPFEVYRALRVTQPSSHMFFVKCPYGTLIGSSPGSLCSVQDGVVADAIRATLPPDSVVGAPRIRAMQIIDELEPMRRGPFGGGVGYFDFTGNLELCTAQHMIVWRNGSFDVQVSTSVVGDTTADRAFDATLQEAAAMLRAVDLATAGL